MSGAYYYYNLVFPTPLQYYNSTFGVSVQYPNNWYVNGENGSSTAFATFYSPAKGVATITLGTEKVVGNLSNYTHSAALKDYMRIFPGFKLLELKINSMLAGFHAYTLIGTYQDAKQGLQKLMEVGTIVNGKAYYMQYIANAPRYHDYLPTLRQMINSMSICSILSLLQSRTSRGSW